MDNLPLIIGVPVLAVAAFSDVRNLRIPNVLSILLILVFLGSCFFLTIPEIGHRVLFSFVTLSLGFALFAMGFVGGGDVKLLAALVLLIPASSIVSFAYVFSFSLFLGVFSIVFARSVVVAADTEWAGLSQGRDFPMGVSIAAAGVLQLSLLHFGQVL